MAKKKKHIPLGRPRLFDKGARMLAVRLPIEMVEKLRKLCTENQRGQSYYMRIALEKLFAEIEKGTVKL